MLTRVLVDAGSAAWSPLTSAQDLVGFVAGDSGVLRAARRQLLMDTTWQVNRLQAHALATLSVAIADIEDTPGGRGERGFPRNGGAQPWRDGSPSAVPATVARQS